MNGCRSSLTGIHVYERHKLDEGEKQAVGVDLTAVCHSCGSAAPQDHRVDILAFLEEAEAQIKEEAERRKKQQASYIRAGKVVK